LKSAGAPDDQARKAAEVVPGYENRFARTETDLTLLMVGFNLAITIGVLMLLLHR
jgi:hypothetical protein